MIEYYQDFIATLENGPLAPWAEHLPEQISKGLCSQRFGDLPKWLDCLKALPEVTTSQVELNSSVVLGAPEDTSAEQKAAIETALRGLIPWRKGPFTVHGCTIDTEWRSDWKWQRLLPHIQPLKDRLVLDVGCGNGYHCLRALGAGAKRVIGIDPSPRFAVQFLMIKHFLGAVPVDLVPIPLEDLPEQLEAFDTTFSMGVLYHRRSPFDHLKALKDTLRPGGELVLETLVVDGPEGYCLVPKGRYAMMNNVWFLPSPATLAVWLEKLGFEDIRLADVNETGLEEQRRTEWMTFHSLEQFLDPTDQSKTLEGHPRPKRAVFTATNG